MALLNFRRRETARVASGSLDGFLSGYSIEVMPRTAEKVEDFRALLPKGTRVYIAHIDGTEIDDMVATARRIAGQGFDVMPHFPARSIADAATLADWIARYQGEAGIRQGLLLGGGIATPRGDFDNSMQLIETGLFDKAGFTHLHVAGHPEGNRDIDTDGGERAVMAAAKWKQDWSERTAASVAMATQFAFEAQPIIDWTERLQANGIHLPVHVGVAGPAKLQTLIKFAVACGVGPSLKVLQKRAMDVTKLVLPYEPHDVLADLAAHKAAKPDSLIEQVHVFPLGGIKTAAQWITDNAGAAGTPAAVAAAG
ncbi:methylenetetrahydrofolate reductase [Oceanicola sp. 22II-s10i]|uniref:5,10-methylenetetrahydrofolate reductase n=1 Tax=Oceanicola sp. 22II-s10i TaxID=1317116 RepID=UPI000B5216C1|nr:5,10-methylenetetrahydrofolate reductase [Oceanicola sp. 22II-s10i]OWU84904.1 methylenetetrahydrofolate reductase [Oceanicola sp. 22II-s10i]